MKLIKSGDSISLLESSFYSDVEIEISGVFIFDDQKNVYRKKNSSNKDQRPAWLNFDLIELEFNEAKTRIIYREYYSSGNLRREIPFSKNGVNGNFYIDGKILLFYEDKDSNDVDTYTILEEKEYDKAIRKGIWKTYSIDGGILSETFYDNIIDPNHLNKVLKWKEYHNSNGQLALTNERDFGKSYYDNGNLKAEWTNNDFKYHGEYREYYEDGVIKITVNYIDGSRDGIMYKYFQNQKLKEQWEYSLGVRNYIKKFYSDGSLKTEIKYKNGIEISKIEFSKKHVE